MNRILVVIALVATFGLVAVARFLVQQPRENAGPSARFARETASEKPSVENMSTGQISVTKQAFDAIKWGMPEAEVRKIMGGEGNVQSNSGRIKIVSFRDGTKLIGVTYRDGRLAGKTQVGL